MRFEFHAAVTVKGCSCMQFGTALTKLYGVTFQETVNLNHEQSYRLCINSN
jgi:hypothetical protein